MNRLTLVNVSKGFSTGLMPLGLISIITSLRKYGRNRDIVLLDSNCQNIYKNFEPSGIVGIGSVTQDICRATAFAKFVKGRNKNIPVILGGVHITTYGRLPEPFDVGVIGEGEDTMLELMGLEDFSKENLKNIRGICYNVDGETVHTPTRNQINPLDRIPIPDRDIADHKHYLKKRNLIPYHTGRTLSMLSSRGCPFHCAFCSTKVHWKRYRTFSAERVIEEMDLLANKYKAEIVHIFDDLFLGDKKRFHEIHKRILAKGLHKKLKFMCLIRADLLDETTMRMLKEMNVVVTGIGMESGNETVLGYLKNHTTTTIKNREAIELSSKYRLPVMGSFMVGNPNETEKELLETLDFIRSYRNSPYLAPLAYIAAAFPGTDFWNFAKEKGIDVDDFGKIMMDIPNTIDKLRGAPLLTDIPLERFFDLLQSFAKENRYAVVKKHLFPPAGFTDRMKAYIVGIMAERSVIKGIREVNNMKNIFLGMRDS